MALFKEASARARQSGVILVDTKLEWGLIDDQLTLIDECFTPDSSRFVLAETYRPNGTLHPLRQAAGTRFPAGLELGQEERASPVAPGDHPGDTASLPDHLQTLDRGHSGRRGCAGADAD